MNNYKKYLKYKKKYLKLIGGTGPILDSIQNNPYSRVNNNDNFFNKFFDNKEKLNLSEIEKFKKKSSKKLFPKKLLKDNCIYKKDFIYFYQYFNIFDYDSPFIASGNSIRLFFDINDIISSLPFFLVNIHIENYIYKDNYYFLRFSTKKSNNSENNLTLVIKINGEIKKFTISVKIRSNVQTEYIIDKDNNNFNLIDLINNFIEFKKVIPLNLDDNDLDNIKNNDENNSPILLNLLLKNNDMYTYDDLKSMITVSNIEQKSFILEKQQISKTNINNNEILEKFKTYKNNINEKMKIINNCFTEIKTMNDEFSKYITEALENK